jgi:hypothetical protein
MHLQRWELRGRSIVRISSNIPVLPRISLDFDLDVLIEVGECAAERTRERRVVDLEKRADAFIVECVGARRDE